MRTGLLQRTQIETELRQHIERGLALADMLGAADAGIWLDRARVSLADPAIEMQSNFEA